MNTQDIIKISVNLPSDAIDTLRNLAARRGTTVTDVIRRAIATEKYLDDVRSKKGSKILIESKRGKIREIVFP